MGTRTRIRWRRAAPLAVAGASAAALLALGPSLLRPPAPEPLPPDVGLEVPLASAGPVLRPAGRPRMSDAGGARERRDRERPRRGGEESRGRVTRSVRRPEPERAPSPPQEASAEAPQSPPPAPPSPPAPRPAYTAPPAPPASPPAPPPAEFSFER